MTALRALIGRFLPQGALVLSVLTFGYFAMGQVRNRVLARTFGAGAELDVYNAAFVLPEVALRRPRRGRTRRHPSSRSSAPARDEETERGERVRPDGPDRRGLGRWPWRPRSCSSSPRATVELIAPGVHVAGAAGAVRRPVPGQLRRPVLFAASIALGEVLVAKRRFLYYGISPDPVQRRDRSGDVAPSRSDRDLRSGGRRRRRGAAHLAIRPIGILRTDFRLGPQTALRMPAVREFLRLMVPRMAGDPIEPLTFQFFTRVASRLRRGQPVGGELRRDFQSVPVSLIGARSPSPRSRPCRPPRAGRSGRVRAILRTNLLTIASLTIVAGIALFVLSTFAIEILLGGGAFDAEDVDRTASPARRSPCRSRSRA